MSVAAVATITFHPLPAGLDPRLPAFQFFGAGAVLGDGSGGTTNIAFNIVNATPTQPFYIVLTSVDADSDAAATDTNPVLVSENFVLDPRDLTAAGIARNWPLETTPTAGNDAARAITSRSLQNYEPGYAKAGADALFRIIWVNDNGITNNGRVTGLLFLPEAANLPGGPVLEPESAALQAKPNYPVGGDAFYADLRRGDPPAPVAQPVVVAVPAGVPNSVAKSVPARSISARSIRQSGVNAAVFARDEQIVVDVLQDVATRGGSINTGISRFLGLSFAQVQTQVATRPRPGQPPPPGARYANLTGRFEEGNGGV